MAEKKTPTIDFIDSPYYDKYVEMINGYKNKIISSILNQNGIDNEAKFTRGDVLKELLKFVDGDMKMFKDLTALNPNRDVMNREEIDRYVEEQSKNLGIMN